MPALLLRPDPRPTVPVTVGTHHPPERPAAPTGHIGRIVTGSIGAGLAGAIALVAGPLAGRREHVVAGATLLAFAVAWALLAVLSSRRTDQPQRWARVPAAFMAGAGGVLLAAAPTGNQLGWVWPPSVAGLAVWMTVRARRSLHSRARTWVLYPVFATLLLAAVGGGYETYRESAEQGSFATPGRLVDVGDHALHLDCTGTGSPTVVLEPGLGEPSTAMALVAGGVDTTTRVCVYDRAGRGWSQAAAHPLDANETADDLHTLLRRAGEAGPFVLAGHSAGGLYVQAFAARHPEEVAGVVLLDAMHPRQATRIASYAGFYEMYRRVSAVMPVLARFGVARALNATEYGDLPARARDAERMFLSTPRGARSARDEFSRIKASMHEAGALRSLGDRPLVVVTAGKDAEPGWTRLQNDLAGRSTDHAHVTLLTADHSMLTGDRTAAAESSAAIRDVVRAVRTHTTLNRKDR